MSSNSRPEVSVIIPTLALRERAEPLRRAIESVTGQQGVAAVPVVVINGNRFDRDLVADLVASQDLTLIQVEPADLPGALWIGRSAIRTKWFATLDDDDVLLPNAMSVRRQALLAAPEFDIVVSNGYRRDVRGDDLLHADMASVSRDPVSSLANGNWLLPGSWLARSERVGPELFLGMPRYLECTFLAIQFVTRYKTVFLPEPTIRWNAATPGGDHLSDAAMLARPAALAQLLSLDVPRGLKKALRRHLASAYHETANYYLDRGEARIAWRQHCKTLARAYGFRHWPLSLKILWRAAHSV